MGINETESLVEIAARLMKSKKKPKTFKEITNDVLQAKGLKGAKEEVRAQFQMDFMLSGYFVCCGENKSGLKLWDLKNRQPSTLLDKDGNYFEELYEYDEEVVLHELKDDFVASGEKIDDYLSDDEEEDEADDIEAELGLINDDGENIKEAVVIEETETEDEEEDEIEKELKSR